MLCLINVLEIHDTDGAAREERRDDSRRRRHECPRHVRLRDQSLMLALMGRTPGPRPTPSSAFGCIRTTGPGGPARTGASALRVSGVLSVRAIGQSSPNG